MNYRNGKLPWIIGFAIILPACGSSPTSVEYVPTYVEVPGKEVTVIAPCTVERYEDGAVITCPDGTTEYVQAQPKNCGKGPKK